MECFLVYVTVADSEEAKKIGSVLVDKRLAACVNILGPCDSLFWWDGGVQSEAEVVFLAKTTKAKLDALIEEVKHLHSYDVPCVVALPIVSGNKDFLQWIDDETGKEPV